MAADIFDTNNILAILLAGRRPEWIRQGDLVYPNGLPDAASGVALRDSPRTQVLLDMREQVRHRICRVNIRVPEPTGTYRTTIDGTNVDFAAVGLNQLAVLTGIMNALNADATVNLVITASLEDRDNDGIPQEQLDKSPPAVHPMIRTHPETNRKLIFAGGFCSGVVGMDEKDGEDLIEELTEFSTRPEFVYVHKWRAGDLIFWDNRCAMHLASDYDPKYRRHMRRTTLKGDTPF